MDSMLFEDQEQKGGFELIGQGFALKKTSDPDKVHLYKNGIFMKEQILKPAIEKRLFVIDLVERQGVTKSKLADALQISRQSIDNWLGTYRRYGSQGLINNTKDSWKKNPKRFTGNKARDLKQERHKEKQELEKQALTIQFDSPPEVEELYCGPARSLYTEEFDYRENRYSGNLLYVGMGIRSLNLINQLSALAEQYLWIPLMFLMMHVNRLSSVEQLKTVYLKEFGQVIGLKKLWNLNLIREQIGELIGQKNALKARYHFIQLQVFYGIVSIWRLFLDGHFVPYSGKEKVHKGYCTQRNLMMPGRTEFFAHDSVGNVVYFDIHEGKGDIHESLREISDQFRSGNGGIAPLVVVDRELWGVDHFISLSGCRFVTWEKNCDKALLGQLPASLFTGRLKVNGKEYLHFEENKTYRNNAGKSIELRRIIVRNTEDGETLAVVSNDRIEDTATLAESMLKRWGCSENSFKHMGVRTQMHYNPQWEIREESDAQQVTNPEYLQLTKKLRKKKLKLNMICKALGKKEVALKKDGTPHKTPARDRMIAQKKALEAEIDQLKEQIDGCERRVDSTETGEAPFKVIDNESKNWWNLTEMLFWNMRKKLAGELFAYLPDERDLLPVLDAITSARGWIKSTKESLIVRLEPLEVARFKDAQVQLCRKMNNEKIKLPNGKLLQFDVGSDPYSVQK